jgi:NAD(P)H-binding
MPLTILFIAASTGCGLSALATALQNGHTCIALLRYPSKIDDLVKKYPSNIIVRQGNAYSLEDVRDALVHQGRLVDRVCSSIGLRPTGISMKLADPEVCAKGMRTLVAALEDVRAQGIQGRPLISALSTTGISRSGVRDYPALLYPLYHWALAEAHADKRNMEAALSGSGERFVIVRPSLLVDADRPNDDDKIRAGIDDPKTTEYERIEIGYTISRGAVGRFITTQVLEKDGEGLEGKAVAVTW